jgi:hypothetical protein
MTKTLMRAGFELETVTPDEARGIIHQEMRQFFQARAKKRMEVTFPVLTPATTVFLGPSEVAGMPEEGYIWSLKMVSVNFSATSTLNIYKATSSGDTRRPLCPTLATQTVQSFTWSSDQARLRHGEGLYLTGSANITGVYVAAWQAPSEMESEVYD